MNAIDLILSDDFVRVEDYAYAPHPEGLELLEPGLNLASGQPISVSPDRPQELNAAGPQFDRRHIAFPVDLSDTDLSDPWLNATQLDAWSHRLWPGWEADNLDRPVPIVHR